MVSSERGKGEERSEELEALIHNMLSLRFNP